MSNPTYTAYLTNLNNNINRNFFIVTTSIGIPCNIAAIIVFSLLIKQKTNMGFLYTIQCLVDLFMILVSVFLIRSTTINLYPVGLEGLNDPMCKFIKFMRRFPIHMSSWMPVLITFDRFIYIFYGQSNRFKFMKKKLNLALIILAMFTMLAIVNVANLMYYLPDRVVYPNGTLGPVTTCTATYEVVLSSDMVSIFFRTYIPFSLMIFLNTLMIRKIFNKSRAAFNQTSLSRREYQFTFSTMAYDLYFLVLNFPFSAFYVVYDVYFYMGALTGEFGALYLLIYFVLFNISFCEQTFSFFMYFAFNKHFRQKVLHLTGRVYGSSTTRVNPSNTNKTNYNASVSAKNAF